jgi:hypothetical protein
METSPRDNSDRPRSSPGLTSKVWTLIVGVGVLLGYFVLRSTLSIVPVADDQMARDPYYAKFLLTNEGEFFVSYPRVQCLASYPLNQKPGSGSTPEVKVSEGNVYYLEQSEGLGPHASTTIQCFFADAEREAGGNGNSQALPVMVLLSVKYRPRYWFPSSMTRRFSSHRDAAGNVQWDAR